MIDLSKFTRIPISEIQTPKDWKICYPASYWIVTPENEVLRFKKCAYQCNTNKLLAESFLKRFPEDFRIEHLPMTFVDND